MWFKINGMSIFYHYLMCGQVVHTVQVCCVFVDKFNEKQKQSGIVWRWLWIGSGTEETFKKCEYITNSKQTENSGKLKYFKLENSRY